MKAATLAFFQPDGEWRVTTVIQAPERSARCILVVPGADVLAREIEVAGVTLAQSRAAALSILAPDLATSADRLICSVAPASAGRQLAFVTSRDKIDVWITSARKAGLSPDMLLPDYAMLKAPPTGEAAIAVQHDAIVRTAGGGFSCQPEFVEHLTTGLRLNQVDLDSAAIDLVRDGGAQAMPNLLAAVSMNAQDKRPRKAIWAASAAAAALIVASMAPWAAALRTSDATRLIRAESKAVAHAALPAVKQIVDPVAQLREAMLPRQRAQNLLVEAAGVLEGLALSPGVSLRRMDLQEGGGIRAMLHAADLSQLEPLRDHLVVLGLTASETPIDSQPNNLSIELVVSSTP